MSGESTTVRKGALHGVRVLDLSTSVAGLQATGHLADNWADLAHRVVTGDGIPSTE